MHKTHIFDQKNNQKNILLPTYLPYFFSDCYRKQTISFFRPKLNVFVPIRRNNLLVNHNFIFISGIKDDSRFLENLIDDIHNSARRGASADRDGDETDKVVLELLAAAPPPSESDLQQRQLEFLQQLQQVQESLRDATSHQRQQELLVRQQELQLEISVIQNQQVEFCFSSLFLPYCSSRFRRACERPRLTRDSRSCS